MYRIKDDTMAELEIKKSRFLCYLHKSFSEADAKDFIQKIKNLHNSAGSEKDYALRSLFDDTECRATTARRRIVIRVIVILMIGFVAIDN